MAENCGRCVFFSSTFSSIITASNKPVEIQGAVYQAAEVPVKMDTASETGTMSNTQQERVTESSSKAECADSPQDAIRKSCETEPLPPLKPTLQVLFTILQSLSHWSFCEISCPDQEWYGELLSQMILI